MKRYVHMYSERLQLLLNIYNEVEMTCFAPPAGAVVSLMDHLKTLMGLETIAESNCPSGNLIF